MNTNTTDLFFYLLHWIFAIGALSFSWLRSCRSYLHPHFIFTIMLVVMISDFLVRGYEDRKLIYFLKSDIYFYQFTILSILTVIVFLTSLIRLPASKSSLMFDLSSIKPIQKNLILFVSLTILVCELLKRFILVDWSLDEVIRQSLMPRGQNDWSQEAYSGGNAVFLLVTSIFPFSSIGLAYLIPYEHNIRKFFVLLFFALTIAILVTNGSRTPVAISFAVLAFFLIKKQRKFSRRLIIISVITSILVVLFSLMYLYRATGYLDSSIAVNKRDFELIYHQDDTYYWAIYAYLYKSNNPNESWDPLFFFGAIIANPIPRAIWSEKPLLTANFYKGFKLDYVTNSFLGEIVAMSGIIYSIFFGPLAGFLIYLILFNSQILLRKPMGVLAYLLMALYTYMCIRSMINIVHYIYLPAFTLCVFMTINWNKKYNSTVSLKK